MTFLDGTKVCVSSCKNLEPTAYINTVNNKCVRNCADTSLPYLDLSVFDKPTCVITCPTYYEELTYDNKKICVSTCKNIIP